MSAEKNYGTFFAERRDDNIVYSRNYGIKKWMSNIQYKSTELERIPLLPKLKSLMTTEGNKERTLEQKT